MKTSFAFSQGVQPGIQSFGARLMGAADMRQKSYTDGIKELGAADRSAAQAEEARAKAEGLRNQESSLGDRLRSLMDITGLPKTDLEQYERQQTGAPVPTAPNGGEPYAMPAPERPPLAEGVMSRILQGTRQLHAQRTGSRASTVDNIAQAGGHFLAQQLQEAARDAYQAKRPTDASAFSQMAKPGTQLKLADNIGSTGGVIDPATGAVAIDNLLGRATVAKLNEQTATEKYRRDQMEAAARLANARAADITPGVAPPPVASGAASPGLPPAKRALTESEQFALEKTATSLGISPADLKTVIQYETGGSFSPSQMGGAGGRHMGLIQFGPNERIEFGAHAGQTFEQQLGSVEAYLRKRGLKPGSDIAKLYTTIIAGNPNVPPEAADQNGTIAYHLAQMTGGAPPVQAPGVAKSPLQQRLEDVARVKVEGQKSVQTDRLTGQKELQTDRLAGQKELQTARDTERERQRIAGEDRKAAELMPEARQKRDNAVNNLDRLDKALAELRDLPGLAGITGGIMGRIPSMGDASTQAQEKYNQVMSNVFITAVQAVKAGGATLGPVTDKEGDKLQNFFGALGRTQSKEALRREIDAARTEVRKSRDVVARTYKDKYGRLEAAGGNGVAGRPTAGASRAGVTFLGFESP